MLAVADAMSDAAAGSAPPCDGACAVDVSDLLSAGDDAAALPGFCALCEVAAGLRPAAELDEIPLAASTVRVSAALGANGVMVLATKALERRGP